MAPHEKCNEEDDMKDITEPRESDVLCGRGGAALRHVGNQTYRRLVNLNKPLYITCLKTEKLKISRSIVAAIREQNGRFLERDAQKGVWTDIGDKKAIEKTSQALREGQPKLKKKLAAMGQLPAEQANGGVDATRNSSTQQQAVQHYGNGIYNPRGVHPSISNVMNNNINDGMDMNFNMRGGMRMNSGTNMNANMNMNMNNYDRAGSGNFSSSTMFASMQQQVQQQQYDRFNQMGGNHMGRDTTGNMRHGMMQNPARPHRDENPARPQRNDFDDDNDLTMIRHLSLDSTPQSIPSWTPSVRSTDSFAMSIGEDIPQMVTNRKGSRTLIRNPFSAPYPCNENRNSNGSDFSAYGNGMGRDGSQTRSSSFDIEDVGPFDRSNEPHRRQQQQFVRTHDYGQNTLNESNQMKTNDNQRSPTTSIKDRRRNFARLKDVRASSLRSGSSRSIDDMPDIHMVDSQFSLLSNLSAHGSKHQGQNAIDMAISTHRGGRKDSMGSGYIGVASRRSVMSGLSKMSAHSVDLNVFSGLSRKFSGGTNHTASSRSMISEFSGIDEDDFAEDDFDFDIPTKPNP